jgi:hypothetical protein
LPPKVTNAVVPVAIVMGAKYPWFPAVPIATYEVLVKSQKDAVPDTTAKFDCGVMQTQAEPLYTKELLVSVS